MKQALALALLGLLVLPLAAFAQDDPQPDCNNAVTQTDMNICADKDYQKADQGLNAAYKQAMTRAADMDKDLGSIDKNYVGAVEALKKAQRAWIGYRDGQCDLAGFSARGGTMEPMLVSSCLADLTQKRTRELQSALKDDSQ